MSERNALNFPNNFTQAAFNISASGISTWIAGAAGKQIKVFRMKLTVGAATVLTIQDTASPANVLDVLDFASVFGMILDFTGIDMPPWYTSAPGASLVFNQTNAVQLSGNVDYLIS
jgi:hypothetical protein